MDAFHSVGEGSFGPSPRIRADKPGKETVNSRLDHLEEFFGYSIAGLSHFGWSSNDDSRYTPDSEISELHRNRLYPNNLL